MTRVCQGGSAVRAGAESKTGGLRVPTAEQPLVELDEQSERIRIEAGRSANCPHEQGDQHSSFETLSCHIAGDDEQASVGFVGDDLKEVATHLAGTAVLALNDESGKACTRLGKHDLLYLLRLPHVIRQANIFALLSGETHQEDDQN